MIFHMVTATIHMQSSSKIQEQYVDIIVFSDIKNIHTNVNIKSHKKTVENTVERTLRKH